VTPARISTQPKTQINRRPGRVPGRRIAFAAASALAGIAFGSGALWPQAIAFADTSSPFVTATVYEPGGQTKSESLTVAQLQSSSACPISPLAGTNLPENGRQGPVQWPLPSTTWALGTVLQCMDPVIDPSAVSSIDVIGADGTPEDTNQYSTITAADLASPSLSPLVSYAGSDGNGVNNVQYNRPAHDASDLDLLDQVGSQNEPIQLFVYEGPSLNVTATSSSGQVSTGTTVTFNASVSPDDSTNNPTYQWTFGDPASPTTATGATATTTYTTAGEWNALVRVTDDTGASGTALVPIQVGSVPTTTNPNQTGTTPQATSSTPTSGTPPGTTKPSHHKPSAGKNGSGKTGTPKPPASSGGSGGGSGAGTAPTKPKQTRTQTQPTSTTPTPTTTTAPTPPQAGGGSVSSGPTSAGQPTATTAGSTPLHPVTTPVKPPPTTRSRHERAPIPIRGRRVVGDVLSSVVTIPAGSSPLVTGAPVADRDAVANRHADVGGSPLAIVLSVVAVLVLLCLGAGRELRQSIDWHTLLARLRRS
jgi:PKD domain